MPLDPSKFDPTKLPRNRSSAQEGVQVAMEWCAILFVGMLAVGYTVGTWWALLAMSLATIGFYGMKPVFWRE